MSRADYEHWNEDADYMWWQEEGRHADADAEAAREEEYSAADAYAEELAEVSDEELTELLADDEYLARWPKARRLIEWELRYRGLPVKDERGTRRLEAV